MEFDLDKALEDVPIHIEDPSPPAKLEKKPSTNTGELPSEECKKLQHYTKMRPKRNKKTNSSKIPVSLIPHTTLRFLEGKTFLSDYIKTLTYKRCYERVWWSLCRALAVLTFIEIILTIIT